MEIIYTLLTVVIIWLIESQIYLSYMQKIHRRLTSKLIQITKDKSTNEEVMRSAREVFGFQKVRNVIVDLLAKPMIIAAWVANSGMAICLGTSVFLLISGTPDYIAWSHAIGTVYFIWLAVKWILLLIALTLTGYSPGTPGSVLKMIGAINFEGDLGAQRDQMYNDNPMLMELEKALKGNKNSMLMELEGALKGNKNTKES
jgi:hypothetical protein